MAREAAAVSTAAGVAIANDVRDAFANLGARLRSWGAAQLRVRLQQIEAEGKLPEEKLLSLRQFVDDIEILAPRLKVQCILLAFYSLWHSHKSQSTLIGDQQANPDIAREPLVPPIMIVGLPRTGSTLLHHLLVLGPGTQCLHTYEMFAPIRSVNHPFLQLRDMLDWLVVHCVLTLANFRNQSWGEYHKVHASLPEECLLYLRFQLTRDTMTILGEAAAGGEKIFAQKHLVPLKVDPQAGRLGRGPPSDDQAKAAYRSYKFTLQHHQLRKGTNGLRFVLKGQQVHLRHLEAVHEAFPEAKVIWTHRNIHDVMHSLCQMRYTQHECACLGSAKPSPEWYGQHVLETTSENLAAGSAALHNSKELAEKTLHVWYDGLIQDPIGTVERIHEFAGLGPVTPEHRSAMEAYLAESKKCLRHRSLHALQNLGLIGVWKSMAYQRPMLIIVLDLMLRSISKEDWV
eukprot:gnl/MRDRNA2_/MRDRNA2_31865_c0_seq1.p1 gnl/MRDRNA2_/MRDRNA2_31865_c0~~gnl/MRDRNA2_/MRDRNA2_31865_c0_seq1.p1  ORF type:complete len:520 (-),score=73.80 gnl/MRDRNA2_/MRDRNA2_31865_c0_seq1:411-1784(-)